MASRPPASSPLDPWSLPGANALERSPARESDGGVPDVRTALLEWALDVLPTKANADEILAATTERVARQLGVPCALVIEPAGDPEHVVLTAVWDDRGPMTETRQQARAQFGSPAWWERVSRGPSAVADIERLPADAGFGPIHQRLAVRSFAQVPVCRDGEWLAGLCLGADQPRGWVEADLLALQELLPRIWRLVQRARATEAVGERERRFRSLADQAPVMMWLTEADGSCSYLNAAYFAFTGQTEAEAAGRGWLEMVHPDDRPEVEAQFLRASARLTSYQSEYRVRRRDGRYCWVLDAAAPRFEAGQQFLGYVGSVMDISDRRQVELSATARAEQVRLALAASNSGDWSWDVTSDIVMLSPRAADIFGIAPGPVITWTAMRGMLEPADAERARRAVEQALATHSDYDIEYRIVRPSGGISWVAARGRGVYGTAGEVRGMIGVLQEINGRKRAEQALVDREERVNQLITLMPAGTYACDTAGRITFVNKRAVELWGCEPQLNSDRNLFTGAFRLKLLDGTPLPAAASPMAVAVREGRSFRNFEALVERPDGRRWVASLNVDPIRDADGRVTGAINVFLDITERKRAENLLAGQNRALQLLAAGAPLPEVLAELANAVERAADGATACILVNDTLTGDRVTVGAAPGLPGPVRIGLEGLPVSALPAPCAKALVAGGVGIPEGPSGVDGRLEGEALLAEAGLVAMWAAPIRGGGGSVLGAIAVLAPQPRSLSGEERETVVTLARAAAIAIERRRAEEATQAAEAQLRLVTDSSPVMLLQCDAQCRVTFVNRAYLERTGRGLEEVLGEGFADVLGAEAFGPVRPYVDLVLAGVRVDFEHELEFPRIGRRTLSVSFVPDRSDDGSVRGWVTASSDITETRRADAATRQLAAIVESSDDAIISKDLSGCITSWNLGAERLFGFTAGEMIGQPMRILIPPDRGGEEDEILGRVRKGEHIEHCETVRLHKDGRRIDVSLTMSPIRDAQRRSLGISTIARDITGRKRQEAELRRREQLYRGIGESIDYGIWVRDAAGRGVYASESLLKLVGLTQEEFAGDGWTRILHPDEREAATAAWAECVRTGTFWEREHTVKGVDGKWYPILARGVPVRDEQGRITSWAGINLDISAFKQAQEAIRQGEVRFRTMADNIAQFAWMAAGDGRIFWFNQRWIDYTGIKVGGDGFVHLSAVHPEHRRRAQEKFERALQEKTVWEDTFPLRGRDGQYRWFLARALPIRDEATADFRWFGTATDVTDLRHTQDVLRQRSKTLETLNRVGNALVAELDLDRIVQTVTEAGREISGAAFGSFIANPASAREHSGSLEAAPREALERFGLPWEASLFEATFRGERVVRVADLHLDPRMPAASLGSGERRLAAPVRSYLAVPVISRSSEVLGGLFFGHPDPGVFTETAQNILTGLAAQAAIAIDNANLYAALQRELVQQKRADAALRASERQLRLVTDHAPVFLVLCDRQYRYKFVNRPYANRHNREPHEVIGLEVAELIGREAFAAVRRHMDAALAGEQVHFELELNLLDVGCRWMEVVYVPERTAEGEVVGLLAVMSDITGRKQVEIEVEIARDRALAASRAKDDFLAALSHELRTPLNPVLLLASEAAEDPQLTPEVRGAFATIRNNVELEARLIDDLLDLTRIARGKLPLDLRAQDAHAILQAALTTVRAEMAQKRINLVLDLTAAPADVWGDAVRLQQIFWNVLKNATKFTPLGGRILVETRRDEAGRRLLVRVSDSGIGLTPDELGRVFEAFTQGDHAGSGGSHLFGGIGLGLAISQMLVEQHQGLIRAESAGRDQGATFTVEIPLAAEPRPSVPRETAAGSGDSRAPLVTGATRRRVLLVEDHEATRQTLAQLLTRRQFQVVSAATLAEARQWAAANPVDLLISDIGLPDGSGYDLMKELTLAGPLPGIALSGYGMEEDVARSRAAGFRSHLTKPIRVQMLDAALDEVLGPR